jgi:hypothetical protein
MLNANTYFCYPFVTSHLESFVGAWRLVKSKLEVKQFISMGTNNLVLCTKKIILEYFN